MKTMTGFILMTACRIIGLALAEGLYSNNILFRMFEQDPEFQARTQAHRFAISEEDIECRCRYGGRITLCLSQLLRNGGPELQLQLLRMRRTLTPISTQGSRTGLCQCPKKHTK